MERREQEVCSAHERVECVEQNERTLSAEMTLKLHRQLVRLEASYPWLVRSCHRSRGTRLAV